MLGFGLQRMMPASFRGDFQDLVAWRQGVFEVPDMTLKGSEGPVDLIAGEGAALRMESFAVSRLDVCLERLQQPEFAEQVSTDHLTIPQVTEG